MNYLSLFSGVEGGGLAFQHLIEPKLQCIGYVEIDDYCQRIIQQRIIDGFLDRAPIFGDVKAFIDQGYAESYKGLVDVLSAGPPCQPYSIGGLALGERDPRNMLQNTVDTIRLVEPKKIFMENVPAWLRFYDFGQFLGTLAEIGYCISWDCISAAALGLHHKRERHWLSTEPLQSRWPQSLCGNPKNGIQKEIKTRSLDIYSSPDERIRALEKSLGEPAIFGNSDGLAYQLDRLKAAGEGQVPAVVEVAWEILSGH